MTRLNSGLFTSQRLDWRTPKAVYQTLDAEFGFAVDACANDGRLCRNWLAGDEGLSRDWPSPAYLNPPYGREIGKWLAKAFEQAAHGVTVVAEWHQRWLQEVVA